MKTPGFWYQSRGFIAYALSPLGWLYGKGGRLRARLSKPKRFPIPIISVGNIVSGGAGKTPTALALLQLLKERGYTVHFVTRGYGGQEKGPIEVDLNRHTAADVGDEPLLLAQYAPTWVAKRRPQGVEKAIEHGAQLIILDDGHQTSSLHKDVSFVVVDCVQGFGNGCVIPAGPLREELSVGLRRADGVIQCSRVAVLQNSDSSLQHCNPATLGSAPLFKAKITPQPLTLPSNRVVAFCGLGFPQKFYMSLQELGFELTANETFPDHYQYTQDDLFRLQKLAKQHDSVLMTTRKDFVKIPSLWQGRVHVLDVKIEFEFPEKICDFILQKVGYQ